MARDREQFALGERVICDTQAFERLDRTWSADLLPHQYVGEVVGTGTMYDVNYPTQLYIVRLCSPDRFYDQNRENGAYVSNLLVHESALLHDKREVRS